MKRARCATADTPLIPILEANVRNGIMVREGDVYVGFASFNDLVGSSCTFQPMNSNRVIDRAVVRERYERNLAHWDAHQAYMDFGELSLLVLRQSPRPDFLVMDGQHRTAAMALLHAAHPERQIRFRWSCKVVDDEAEAWQALRHFQDAHPSDPRSFFPTQAQNARAAELVERVATEFPDTFRRQTRGDPDRPYLNDGLVYDLAREVMDCADPWAELLRVNARMARMSAEALQVRSEGMLSKCRGCFLGLLRPRHLTWRDVA